MLAISLSNSLSINDKKTLSKEEMITLKIELLKCENPTICPAGNRTILIYDRETRKPTVFFWVIRRNLKNW